MNTEPISPVEKPFSPSDQAKGVERIHAGGKGTATPAIQMTFLLLFAAGYGFILTQASEFSTDLWWLYVAPPCFMILASIFQVTDIDYGRRQIRRRYCLWLLVPVFTRRFAFADFEEITIHVTQFRTQSSGVRFQHNVALVKKDGTHVDVKRCCEDQEDYCESAFDLGSELGERLHLPFRENTETRLVEIEHAFEKPERSPIEEPFSSDGRTFRWKASTERARYWVTAALVCLVVSCAYLLWLIITTPFEGDFFAATELLFPIAGLTIILPFVVALLVVEGVPRRPESITLGKDALCY